MNEAQDERVRALQARVAALEGELATARSATARRLHEIADALPVMISYIDRDLRYRFANKAYEACFSRPLAEIVDRPISEVISADDFADREPYLRRVLAGERVTYEATLNGRRVLIHHIPHVERGVVAGFYALIQDTTEQWEALRAASESEARFRRIADSAPIPMWLTAPDRTRAFVNIAYADFLGLSYDEARVFDWRTILHPEDHDRIVAASIAGEAAGERFVLEARYLRADRQWRWLRSISQPRFDEAGAPVGFIGVAEDVTEARHASEVAARHANDLTARANRSTRERDRLWALSRDPITICDRDGTWRSASPAWTTLLGWSIDRLVGRTAEWIEHPDDRAGNDDMRRLIAGGQGVHGFTNRLRAADGGYRWVSWSAASEGDSVYCIARDVTDERQQAEALHAVEDALRQSQKVEALGQLTGGVAHDFNNLLTPILGALDLLQRRGLGDARMQRLVDGALQSADRARALVQRLLAFARRQPLQMRAVAMAPLVLGLENLLRSSLGRHVDLAFDIGEDVPAALADPNQIEMALLNLVVNARDAMPDGGLVEVVLARRAVPPGMKAPLAGNYVSLLVRDNGPGMDAETLRRAVEPFFSTKPLGAGTGLGLSMVNGLAEQLGGALRIESAIGAGTTIELLLPISTDPVAVADAIAARGQGRPLRVLLIDNDVLARASTRAMLETLGHQTVECGSGGEALHRLAGGYEPELVVADMILPDMAGNVLLGELRRRRPALRIIAITGYAATADNWLGGVERLDKPFKSRELTLAIAAVMRGAAIAPE